MKISSLFAGAAALFVATSASAFTITAVGNVTALTNKNQMLQITGQTSFEEGPAGTNANANTCAAQGLFWYQGVLSAALPGVKNNGQSFFPQFVDKTNTPYFPNPAGGGSQTGKNTNYYAGVATFNQTITQVGLTACTNGDQYLTAWDKNGNMLGQVNWHPVNDSSFIGIDTKGVPIGLIAYGNHDVWNGADYGVGGLTIISDDWVWGPGAAPPPCNTDADCDDKNACDGVETCDPNTKKCVFGMPLACDDKNSCTDDSCDPVQGCVYAANQMLCDDGNTCTTGDMCQSGVCTGTPLNCDDSNPCTDDQCDPMVGCTHNAMAGACDDMDACTMNDQCTGGTCTGDPIDCDDKNACTDDTCDALTGCSHTDNTASCDDHDACTMNDACSAGTCRGTAIDCDDKNPCTLDDCDPNAGCTHKMIPGCVACMMNGMNVSCDDKDVCTTDSCGMKGCEHAKIDGCCHDDADCNENESCDTKSNQCVQTSTPVQKAGCSCRAVGYDGGRPQTPGEAPSSNGGWAALVGLALALAVRRRDRSA